MGDQYLNCVCEKYTVKMSAGWTDLGYSLVAGFHVCNGDVNDSDN
jgi:hypothetical protein